MTLKGGIVASLYTTVPFQAFNELEQGVYARDIFVRKPGVGGSGGRDLLCLGLKGSLSIRGEDTYV